MIAADDYAEVLGLYLGDGHITVMSRSERLRLFLDAAYAEVIAEADAALRRLFPENAVGRATRCGERMVVLCLYSQHLRCLFPQHGAGKKHERRVLLEPWQGDLVSHAALALPARVHQVGRLRLVNRTGPYEYLSYHFTNLSQDILELSRASARAWASGRGATRGTSG